MIPDAELAQRLAGMQSPGVINLIIRACGEIPGNRAALVHAAGSSWIDLAGAADRDQPFDHTRAYVHYADQGSSPIWVHMRQAAEKLADQLGALSKPGEDRHEVGSTWHDSGTLFMGDDPAASVTDSLGHFHHIANIACVDQALFPTVGSANPVLTGLCLSRRVAEVIVDRSVSTPALGAAEIAAEKSEGFNFLLEGANGALWLPNNGRLNASRPHLILGGSIIEVHGDAGDGVLFFDDPVPYQDFELRLQWKTFRDVLTGDNLVSEGDLPDAMTGAGCIAVQYHTGKVQFRDLRVRRM